MWASANYPSKPLLISETGGGGVYEWVNDSAPQTFWSQNYQAELVAEDATVLASNARVSGLSLWQMSDIRVDACDGCPYQQPTPAHLSEPWTCTFVDVTCGRPASRNNKGSVDAWRRPKLVYAAIAKIFATYINN